jgi:hypothetical protein
MGVALGDQLLKSPESDTCLAPRSRNTKVTLTVLVAVGLGACATATAFSGDFGGSVVVAVGQGAASGLRSVGGFAAGVGFADGFTARVSAAAGSLSTARWPFRAGLSSGLIAAGRFAGSSAASGLFAFLEVFFAIVRLFSVRNFNFRAWHNMNEVPDFKPQKGDFAHFR